jgi:hypothetical protein
MTPLRFTHAQIRFEPDHVTATLRAVISHLQANQSHPGQGER